MSAIKARKASLPTGTKENKPKKKPSALQQAVRELASNEIVFAVVGPIGSGTSLITTYLAKELQKKKYEPITIKASDGIAKWSKANGSAIPNTPKLARATALQDAGDLMRSHDVASIAKSLIEEIRTARAVRTNQQNKIDSDEPIIPDGNKRAYILDSLKHPAEVTLLRSVYQESFCLIAVSCDEDIRLDRLHNNKFSASGLPAIKAFMKRDEKASAPHGQKVSDTFHLADFFVDNAEPNKIDKNGKKTINRDWDVPEQLGRLLDILVDKKIVRPTPGETGMFYAFGAKMRSACLSRQVGAALLDNQGNVIATGANEVPQAGGGVYGGSFELSKTEHTDHRCAFSRKYCSNTYTQNEIINEIIDEIPELSAIGDRADLISRLRDTSIAQLIEYSRAVHAEMDVLLSSARQGVSPVGKRMFVTTFPCHNCARHIVSAGVDEVQFIEPYMKSRALTLHEDSITRRAKDWVPPSQVIANAMKAHRQVLFRPFTGVAPKLYRRAFLKDRDLKNDSSGLLSIGESNSEVRSEPLRVGYASVEVKLKGNK